MANIDDFFNWLTGQPETTKHLGDKHDQKRHGWRMGSLAAVQRTMQRIPEGERAAFRKRAEQRLGMGGGSKPKPEPKPSKAAAPSPKPASPKPESKPAADDISQRAKAARESVTAVSDKYDKKIATLERQRDRAGVSSAKRKYQEQINDLTEKRNAEARKALYVDNPADVKANIGIKDKKAANTAVSEFNKMVDRSIAPDVPVGIKPDSGRRSYYQAKDGSVRMAKGQGTKVIIHEMGHWLEDKNPAVRQKVHGFLERRTQSDSTQSLAKAAGKPGYGSHEVTKVDKFINAYMGKQYVSGGKRYATEILSMGLEMFYSNPAKLARLDPEFFDFVFAVTRGF